MPHELDPVILSRIQFGFVISFHIIFPAFTIGLAAWLATIEGARLVTGKALYRRVFDFWLPIFAVSFGMGVVTGIVMAFQFGTNWGVLAVKTGSIQGPLLGYEGFTAFMLEATFFGVMLLGRDRVSPRFYFFSCCMVTLGTMFSSFWILANNSWMQVPLGHTIVDGKIIPADWLQIVLGPVQMVRWPHMLLAALLTSACASRPPAPGTCCAACTAPRAAPCCTGAWASWRSSIPVQLFFGHLTGEYVLEHQPAKFAAIEARWKNEQPASETLIAHSRRGARAQPLRDHGAQARQPDRLGQPDGAGGRARILPARRPAAGADPLLRLPHHGRHGAADAGRVLARQPAALARHAGDFALVPVGDLPVLPERLHGDPDRLVHRRGRAPALGGLRPAAHPRRGHAGADRRATC